MDNSRIASAAGPAVRPFTLFRTAAARAAVATDDGGTDHGPADRTGDGARRHRGVPLLAGCGAGTSAQTAAPAASGASSASDPSWPSPTSDPGQDTKAVQAATEKFVRTVLTIGYPDKTFGTTPTGSSR